MERKILFGIIAVLVITGIIFISGCVEKECKSNVDCLTKTCFTVQCKDNKCVYSPVTNCCGNEICEINEIYPECATDCPNCDDDNECTKDSYDYHEKKCVNIIIPNVICCGNKICETRETYETCAQDCPNCNDGNECTKDWYDYHEQKCINELIIPCCGNGICDEDAETHLNCLTDCPNCDDSNRLTEDSFDYKTQKCKNIVTHYFIDDFEGRIKSWVFPGKEGEPIGWSTMVEDGNTVLRGTGHNWAKLWKEWDAYAFKFRFKRVEGSMHVNFRHSCTEEGCNRYLVSISKRGVDNLNEDLGGSFQTLKQIKFGLDEDWHTLEIRNYDNIINIYVDDELLIKYKDTENPFLSGGVSFETHTGGRPEIQPEFLIDDVEIKLITEKDVIYP